jgi:class 3 adenylate cyclase
MEASHTFLFADLVGFTALAELEGDDRALEVVLALQQHARGMLNHHNAEEVKAIGDGLMLRCDDPCDAVLLGLALVRELEAETAFPPVRVGIHTGPALTSDGDWYGRTVNVAARLCAVAPGGEVMVSETARQAAGVVPHVDWSARELHWLRNVSEPVATYLVSATTGEVAERSASTQTIASAQRPGWRGAIASMCPKSPAREATA